MTRWLWILVAIAVSTSVYFTIRYGLRPKPIPVLNPTKFENLQQIGIVIYNRLRQNIRAERIVLLGSSEDVKNYTEVWTGLIEAARADKENIVLVVREGMAPLPKFPGVETLTFNDQLISSSELFTEVTKRLKRKQLVILHGWTRETTHLVADSLSQRLDPVIHQPLLAISTMRLAVDQAEVDDLQPQCLDASPGANEYQKLLCASFKVARKFLKKHLDPEKIWGVMERHGLKEYLVFVHQPS
ncbi:MAG: hypothetical protein AB7F86_01065 [Bdellovibrionales bacterium]